MPTIEEIRQIKKKIEPELLALPGVTGVDISLNARDGEDDDSAAIVVYVANVAENDYGSVIPAESDGVPIVVRQRRFKAF